MHTPDNRLVRVLEHLEAGQAIEELFSLLDDLIAVPDGPMAQLVLDRFRLPLEGSDEELIEMACELAINHGHKIRHELEQYLSGSKQESISPPVNWSQDFLRTFIQRFGGREGVYALQYAQEGRSGYRPVHRDLTPAVLAQHLGGRISCGVYLLNQANQVHFFAIDLDIRRAILDVGASSKKELLLELRESALKLYFVLDGMGLSPILEFSGHKGFHLWCLLAEPMPAEVVRSFATKAILPQIKLDTGKFQAELFPKQDKLNGGGLGNLIKLPLGKHLKSGHWSVFLDSTGSRIKDPVQHLQSIPPILRSDFLTLCARPGIDRKQPKADQYWLWNEGETVPSPAPVRSPSLKPVEIQQPKFGSRHESIQILQMRSGCDTLRNLGSRIETHCHADKQETHTLIYMLALLGEEGILEIHRILSKTLDYNADEVNFKIRAVSPHPISCPKVRKRIPEVARSSRCNCIFDLPENAYPSPVIHAGLMAYADGKVTMPAISPKPAVPQSSTDRLMQDIIDCCRQYSEVKGRLHEMATIIRASMELSGSVSVITESGKYLLSIDADGLPKAERIHEPEK